MKKGFIKSAAISSAIFLSISAFGAGASAQTKPQQPQLAKAYGDLNLRSSEKTTVIVELKEKSFVEAKQSGKAQSKENLKKVRDNVKAKAQKTVKTAKVNREYDHVFSGFSIELPADEIPKLLALPEVKAVYPNVEFKVTLEKALPLVEKDAYSPQMMNSAPYIGANEAWETGFTGKGIKVAVIDTGVDYTHPDLKGNFKKYKGYDFVDDDNDPQETPKGDPRGEETIHGTHVAGTVAANGGIKGVAPDAQLLGYRVLGPGGSGSTEDVIAGIEQAVEDGADVMNLSLGNSINDPDWATSIALDWAMAEGVVAVTSNGNAGPENWTVGSPGTSRDAISVGATQLPYNTYNAVFAGYESAKVMGFPSDEELLALSGKEMELVFAGLGKPADFEGKDFKGKIAVISRGEIPFVDKASAAKAAGAVGAVIYNNVAGEVPDVAGLAVPSVKLTAADGQKLVNQLNSGNNKATFTFTFAKKINETVADFSSRGPVVDTWMIKPDVSAPGVNIVSTVPTHDPADPYGYAPLQGTSMASPHVAGAAALLLQAHKDWKVEDVKAALMNTAENLYDPNKVLYPHNTQGAGSIRVVDAINAKTLVTPGSHSFGVFSKEKGKQHENQFFTIKNESNKAKTYSFDVQFKNGNSGIHIVPQKNLKVKPDSSRQINFSVIVDASKLPSGYHEGTLTVSDGKTETEVPTILFVKEPDYPRVALFGTTPLGNNTFEFEVHLPGGAEELEFWVYNEDLTEYYGEAGKYTNVSKGFQTFKWDGKIGNLNLPPGKYQLFAYAKKQDKSDYLYNGEPITIQ
ncbi:S8 family serine peptidase [Metabacillus indicus]|uniref:Peptidase S8 n=1 Tax=Metabacillus indicus TaxID=246786 RepID=A0A084GNT6_METID|nr:S8 family serine peptidase [Metabacillus indicus]KEZ48998.1 peptidase S8 [Metabacillus indicus]